MTVNEIKPKVGTKQESKCEAEETHHKSQKNFGKEGCKKIKTRISK